MAYVITDACVKDFVCVEGCSTAAIRPALCEPDTETVTQLYINPDDCIDCGSCADICAQNAIFPEENLPEEKMHFAEKNRAYFQ